MPRFATGFDYARGTVFRPGRLGSLVAIKHIDGPIFESKEAAEQCGLQLCRGNGLTERTSAVTMGHCLTPRSSSRVMASPCRVNRRQNHRTRATRGG